MIVDVSAEHGMAHVHFEQSDLIPTVGSEVGVYQRMETEMRLIAVLQITEAFPGSANVSGSPEALGRIVRGDMVLRPQTAPVDTNQIAAESAPIAPATDAEPIVAETAAATAETAPMTTEPAPVSVQRAPVALQSGPDAGRTEDVASQVTPVETQPSRATAEPATGHVSAAPVGTQAPVILETHAPTATHAMHAPVRPTVAQASVLRPVAPRQSPAKLRVGRRPVGAVFMP